MGGLRECLEIEKIMKKNLVKLDQNRRPVQFDGSELPRVLPREGGVAHVFERSGLGQTPTQSLIKAH